MAKRRKEKDEEEDKPFKIPKFDEEAFFKRERRNIKATFISFLFGCFMALICFGFWALMGKNAPRWELVLLVGVINAAFLKYIFLRLNLDLTDFARKNWFGSYAIYFFTWLVVFIIIVNPPFYDDGLPLVNEVVLPGIQELGGSVKIVAKITDNAGVNKDSIQLEITDPNDNTTTLTPESFEHNNSIVIFNFENPDNLLGEFTYKLTAKDVNDKTKEKTGSFEYSSNTIAITSSRFTNITSGDDITIEVEEDVSNENFLVYYRLYNSNNIYVDRKYPSIPAEYETSPEYEGWSENSEFNMTLYIKVSHYFTNIHVEYNNTIIGSNVYEFSTTSDSRIGKENYPVPWDWNRTAKDQKNEVNLNYDNVDKNKDGKLMPEELNNKNLLPHPHIVQAPGFETLVFLIALIGVVLIFKYRKKNRRKQK